MENASDEVVVYARSCRDRLRLLEDLTDSGADFHSLVWERLRDTEWTARRTISHEQFQSHHLFRRWIADIHSFDPEAGVAVIQVAEGDTPELADESRLHSVAFHYSWRLWDLINNREVERLLNCDHPFQAYSGTAPRE